MPTFRLTAALAAAAALAAPTGAHAANDWFDLGRLPQPPVSGQEIAADVEDFSTSFAHRVGGSPAELMAAGFLREEARKLGYEAEIVSIPITPGDPGTIGRAVIATRKGATRPDEHLLFVGHYDAVPQTINGAYDNASGTSMIRALAKSMATVPTNRTISFIWYSNEEQGLLASEAHAAQAAEAGLKVRAVLGFDMVGIAYPVASPGDRTCLCMWHGEEDEALEPLLRHVHFDHLKFPEDEGRVQFMGVNSRNSDERSWDAQGYPVLRWAGLPTASTYPAYHLPNDTIATIEEAAGGRAFFEEGLRNTLLGAYYTALTLDNAPPVARATSSGTGPVTFDATRSSDADGPLSRFQWDFGDGTTAVGDRVTHGYAKPGTYTARLTVGDNLWGPVARSVDVPVTVTTGTAPVRSTKKKAKRKRCGKRPGKRASTKRKRAYKRCVKKRKRAARRRL